MSLGLMNVRKAIFKEELCFWFVNGD